MLNRGGKQSRPGLLLTMFVLSCLPMTNVAASELGDLFGAYQTAVKEGDVSRVSESAAAVYDFTKRSLPVNSKNRASATLNYAKALFNNRQYKLAEDVSREALEAYQEAYGEDAIELVDPNIELARAVAGNTTAPSGHRVKFNRYLRQALKIAEKQRGKESALYALVALDAGRIALDKGKSPAALGYLETALEVFEGPQSKYTLNRFLANFYLGKFYMAKGSHERARPYLESALVIADTENAPDNPLELTARAFLVDVYESLGEADKSIAQCRAIGKMVPFDMEQEPQPLFRRMPEYPAVALKAGREGYAIVNFTISDAGIPEDITAIETDGSVSFGRAAEDFVKRLRYAPRFEDGKPIDTPDRKIKVSFNLAK